MEAFHSALARNDIETWYKMSTPMMRDNMDLQTFKKSLRQDKDNHGRMETKMTATLFRRCSCHPMGDALRCVLIADVAILENGESRRERPLEMWEYTHGDWYWGYLGAESRGRCPGEH